MEPWTTATLEKQYQVNLEQRDPQHGPASAAGVTTNVISGAFAEEVGMHHQVRLMRLRPRVH